MLVIFIFIDICLFPELDSPAELEKKHICRIITKDFPQYFAVVSRIKQESDYIGPEGGVLTSESVPMVRAAFPPGALMKKIHVGLQVNIQHSVYVCIHSLAGEVEQIYVNLGIKYHGYHFTVSA